MKKWPFALAAALLIVLGIRAAISPSPALAPFTFHHENVLGTSLELKVAAVTEAQAALAESVTLAEIDRQVKILSSYDPASEFSNWSRTHGRPIPVSPDLLRVLSFFDRYRHLTGGALDASAEGIVRVWKNAAREGRMPSPSDLSAAVELARQRHWSLDPAAGTATHLDSAPLALNSFTKSYIISAAADSALSVNGVRGLVLNIGGDLVVRGAYLETVRIADPRSDAENSEPLAQLQIENLAVATSGDYRRGVEIGGRHYSHIVDPRTGATAEDVISSTVIAKDPSEAGALATAFSVLKPEESRNLAATVGDVDYLIVTRDGRQLTSPRWNNLLALTRPLPKPFAPQAAAAKGAWNPNYELLVTLELARIEGQRVRRPFVAVWIEDRDKFPVRTVELWFDKARYLPEMRAWYHDDRVRAMAEGNDITSSVSSATRPSGKYTFKWDGKDNKGKLVKPGVYTVYIEAAREHGTYQLLHQEVDFNGAPKQFTLPGGTEISSASLDYRKLENH